jgi:hypothetical protein
MHELRPKPVESAYRAERMHEPLPSNSPAPPDEALALTDWFLGKASQLAQEPRGAAKCEQIAKLIEDARLEGLDINGRLVEAAGETPESILPTELDALINLLATLRRGLGEPRGTRDRYTTAYGRIESALYAHADDLKAFPDLCGRPCLQHPRLAVEWLLASPETCDLVLPDFAALQSEVPVAELQTDAEAVPAQPPGKPVPWGELMKWARTLLDPMSIDEAIELAEPKFPGKHVSRRRMSLALGKAGIKLKRGRPPGKGKTGPSPRSKS